MAPSEPLATQAGRYFTLADGESIIFACRPAKLPRFALYLITLGLYESGVAQLSTP